MEDKNLDCRDYCSPFLGMVEKKPILLEEVGLERVVGPSFILVHHKLPATSSELLVLLAFATGPNL